MLPLLVVSLTTVFSIGRYVDNAYLEGVRKSVNSACGLTEHLISEAERVSLSLAENENSIKYLTDSDARNYVSTRIIRECSRIAERGYYETYVIPADSTVAPLGRVAVPTAYSGEAFRHWGILGKLERNSTDGFSAVAQPHTDRTDRIPLAIGIPIKKDSRVVGYVVTDIRREAFSDFLGINVSRIGALNDLFITDSTGCILYSLIGNDREGRFFDQIALDTEKLITFSRTVNYGICITGTYPTSAKQDLASRISSLTVMLTVISSICAVGCSLLISRSISSPVARLTESMHKIGHGDFSVHCPLPRSRRFFFRRQDDISFLINHFNDMVTRIDRLMKEAVLKQKFLRIAEVKALQSQINPHFLYNTLSSIRSMAKLQGADNAADMVTLLARILRERISKDDEMSTIQESVNLAKDYFMIETYRWPGRFHYKESIDSAVASVPIPKLVIQPVVENALVHGLENRKGQGILEIRAAEKEGVITIRVSDNGPGIPEDRLTAIRAAIDAPVTGAAYLTAEDSGREPVHPEPDGRFGSSGIALVNTHRRLRLLYGPAAGLRIFSYPGEGTCVEICYNPGESNNV